MGSGFPVVLVRLRIAEVASILVLFVITSKAACASIKDNNLSRAAAAGLFWSAEEEADLLADTRDDSAASAFSDHDRNDIDGGFSTIDGMLQWAIGHSDPAVLKEAASDIERLSTAELESRRLDMKELMDKLKTPSDAQMMQIAIDDLKNSSLSLEAHHRALMELLILVEPIDNANDLSKLGGLAALTQALSHPDSEMRRITAWVLGKASQNNPVVQKQVLELGALTTLMKMVNSSSVEEAIKALYAVSALIRYNLDGQELFYSEAGDSLLQGLLSNSSIDIRLCIKAVALVSDLVHFQLDISHEAAELPLFGNPSFLKSVVDLTASMNLDLKEKALVAIKNLLQLRSTTALVLEPSCGLESALERLDHQFHNLMINGDERSYAMDLQNLRKEVESMFHKKLEKVGMVPT